MNRKTAHALTLALVVLGAVGCTQKKPPPIESPRMLASTVRMMLIDYTNNPSALLRSHAIEALAESNQRTAAHFILEGLNDDYWGVRFSACMSLMEMRYIPAKNRLVKRLNDKNHSVRAAAAGALHAFGDHRYTGVIGKAFVDKDVVVRRNTALVLGRTGDRSAVKLLKSGLKDDDLSVRLQVLEAMVLLGHAKSQRQMTVYCDSMFDDEAAMALLALSNAGCTQAIDQIVKIYEKSDETKRLGMKLIAGRALAMLDDDRVEQAALKALTFRKGKGQEAAQIRKLACMALAEIGNANNLRYLAPLVDDENDDVRIAAALAVLRSTLAKDVGQPKKRETRVISTGREGM